MIPKIIHYCWFGRKKKPQDVINNIRNWQIVMPDYQIKEWNEDNFDLNSMTFTKEAYLVKKYAYVSDVVRLYALMTEGGIYLDTDVRALKPFDSYLHHSSFIGLEATSRLSTAVIGAMKATPWIHSFYTTYQRKHFIASKGRLLLTPNPYILTDFFNRNNLFENKEAVEVYGIEYFCAKIYPSMEYVITDKTVAVHEFYGSWLTTSSSRLYNLYIRYLYIFRV